MALTVGGLVKSAFVKDAGKAAASNLFTGKKLNGGVLGAGLAVGTVAAMGGPRSLGSQNLVANSASDMNNIMGPGIRHNLATRHAPPEQATAPSILAGARESGGSNAPTLGASGDMVFGMHNSRHKGDL